VDFPVEKIWDKISMQPEYDNQLKCGIVGDYGVGKSSLMLKFTRGQYTESYISTIGIDFAWKWVDLNEKTIKLQIWDYVSNERLGNNMKRWKKHSNGMILVYDITDRSSFANIRYHLTTEKEISPEAVYVLVGNKLDFEENRQVPAAEAEAFAVENGIIFMETSCKEGINVETPFKIMIQSILAKKKYG
jgi:Ras-related protein Rab-1A